MAIVCVGVDLAKHGFAIFMASMTIAKRFRCKPARVFHQGPSFHTTT